MGEAQTTRVTVADVLAEHQMTTNTRTAQTMCTCGSEPPSRGPRGEFGRWLRQHQTEALAVAGLAGQVIVVHHHDIESHAESFNEGYETAVAQGLADDPTLAMDWLAAHDREVEARALREAADRAVNLGTVSGSGVDVGRRAEIWLRREADRIASP